MAGKGEKSGGRGLGIVIFAFLLSLGIIVGVWGYLIKTNKYFGLGEILRPHIQDIPIVNMILPVPDENSPHLFTKEQLIDEYTRLTAEKQILTAENEKLQNEKEETANLQAKYNVLLKEIDYLNKELDIAKSKEDEKVLEQEKEKNIKALVKTYETMDSAEAAKILEQMGKLNIELVMKICREMKTASFSAILQEMDTNFAAILSERMLEE